MTAHSALLFVALLSVSSTAFVPAFKDAAVRPRTTCDANTLLDPSTSSVVSIIEPRFVDMSTDPTTARQVYDGWAEQYTHDIRLWGYKLPEQMADLLIQYLPPTEAITVLDTGAGDGLSGLALQKAGYQRILGDDLSPGMLKIAEHRGCYSSTRVVDLSKPLPYETNSMDAVTCIGTLTYVDPTAGTLDEFVRVVKPGGYVCYSNRTDKTDKWQEEAKRLENENKWRSVKVLGPVPYLPNNPEFGEEVQVVLYLYRVL